MRSLVGRDIELEFVPLRDLEPLAPAEGAATEGILSPRERDQCRRFKTAKRRRDWTAGRLAAKRLVRRRLAAEGNRLAMSEIEVRNRDTGEPYVESPAILEDRPLSISHSRRYALAALGRPGTRLGIDLEMVEERGESWLELLAHPSESFQSLDRDPVRQTILWTLKEAVVKAIGVGLAVDLWDVRFLPDPHESPLPVLGPARLEMHGKALAVWEALGRPEFSFRCTVLQDGSVLSIAHTRTAERVSA